MKIKLAAAVIVMTLFAGSSAQAATLDSDDVAVEGVVNTNDCPYLGANGSYHSATYIINHRDAGGVVMWRIKLRGQSCVDRYGKITHITWTKSAYVNPTARNDWEWREWWGTWNGGGVGYTNAYRRVQGHLELCTFIGSILCSLNAYPYVSVTMTNSYPWSNGSVSKGMN